MHKPSNHYLLDFHQLQSNIKALGEQPAFHFLKFWTWLKWKIAGKRKDQTARSFLRENYRNFYHSVVSDAELREKFDKFSQLYSKFQDLEKQRVVCEDEAKQVAELVKQEVGLLPEVVDLTQVIGSHTGPGLIALFFIGKDGK